MGSGRASRDQYGGGSWRVDSRSILGHIEVNSRPYLRKPHRNLKIAFIWPWVGSCLKNRLNRGSWDGPGLVPGIALPGTHPPPHPGYTPRCRRRPDPHVSTAARVSTPEQYGRGAQIRRPTHFRCPNLSVLRYYRGL